LSSLLLYSVSGNANSMVLIDQQSVGKRTLHLMDTINAKKRWKTNTGVSTIFERDIFFRRTAFPTNNRYDRHLLTWVGFGLIGYVPNVLYKPTLFIIRHFVPWDHRLSINRPTKRGKENSRSDRHCQCEKEMEDHLLACL
jgi:hypothetical protein